jgi:hypothetical protein
MMNLLEQQANPPREFSLMPFWFWNDDLSEREILRQIQEFDDHGVYGFVIHPRVGLPRHIGWMSDAMLRFMDIAIREARRREMSVILYDEGMYPSGASSGQVVAGDPDFACRGLAMLELHDDQPPPLEPGQNLVARLRTASGRDVAIIDRKVRSVIRGVHYIDEGPEEDTPPMSDILNPDAVAMFIRLVYDRYHEDFGEHFGATIPAIFTDEPNPLGRVRERNVKPGTTGILEHVNRILGYDFTPHLPALWIDDEPDAEKHRRDYDFAIRRRMEETWYQPLHDWCEAHDIALCGHPAHGDEVGALRYFQIPGQDLVWRWVEPDKPTAIEGPESTQGKGSSSTMIHFGRRRNCNEFCGAYGHETTFEEFQWLANWCLVRGVNLLIPHAFYYSIRGPRRDERPPQVGPHSQWWNRFKPFADACRRLCWINTDAQHVCDIAILTHPDRCPWLAAKLCFEHQWDFNYLEDRLLLEEAEIDAESIRIAGMHYAALIVEDPALLTPAISQRLAPMQQAGHVILYQPDAPQALLDALRALRPRDVETELPAPGLRFRHLLKNGEHFYILFNETAGEIDTALTVSARGRMNWINPATGTPRAAESPLRLSLRAHEIALLQVVASS